MENSSRSVGRGHSLAESFSPAPATGNCGIRVQTRFDFLLPAAAALSILNWPALSEAGSAERGVGAIRQPPPKASPNPPNAGQHPLCSPSPRRTRHKPPSLQRTDSPGPRICPNPAQRAGFGRKSGFFSTAAAATLSSPKSRPTGGWLRHAPAGAVFAQSKEKWGPHPPVPRPWCEISLILILILIKYEKFSCVFNKTVLYCIC